MSAFWSLRRRILLSIVALLLATVGSTMAVLHAKMKDAAARGNYLLKHMNRYLGYQELGANSLLVMARLAGQDPKLTIALSQGELPTAVSARNRLMTSLESVQPVDLLAVYDRDFRPMAGAEPLGEGFSPGRVFEAAGRGQPMTLNLQLPSGEVEQVAVAPVIVDGVQIGSVAIGQKLSRLFRTYSRDSDEDKEKQHQLALTAEGAVLAATPPEESWSELAAGLASPRIVKEAELDAVVFQFMNKTFDLDFRPMTVVDIDGRVKEAALSLFRVRTSYETRVAENLYPVLYVGGGALLAAILIAFLLSSTIIRPIVAVTQSIRAIVTGEADLTQRLEIKGKDELAQLSVSINDLFSKVNTLAWRIREVSLKLGQSSQEISHVSTRTYEGARDQVSRIENSTSLTNELSRTIQEIATRANQGAQIARLGRDSVEASDKGMVSIKEAVHDSWSTVNDLKENVEKIGAIAQLISRITEENSMLALNASIEAARAGAAGQGFAVVAQQMREQAKRVEKSSRDIIENIRSIQRTTQALVDSMEGSKEDVDNGAQLVNITLHHLSELSTIMQETAESVKEQAAASDDIARMMLDVQRIAHEALEASQQTVDEGASIRDKAHDLALLVGRFKVKEISGDTEPDRQLPPPGGSYQS